MNYPQVLRVPVVRACVLTAAALTLFALGQGAVQAVPLVISGNAVFTPGSSPELSFTNAPFTATFAAPAVGQSATIVLGSFNLIPLSTPGQSGLFQNLQVLFNAASGVTPGSGNFTGETTIDQFVGTSNALVDYATGALTFSFANAGGTGTFSLLVNSVAASSVTNGQAANQQTALLTLLSFTPAAAVPEPATVVLLGLGLSGVAGAVRRRRRRRQD